jgi:hypothetical protein
MASCAISVKRKFQEPTFCGYLKMLYAVASNATKDKKKIN